MRTYSTHTLVSKMSSVTMPFKADMSENHNKGICSGFLCIHFSNYFYGVLFIQHVIGEINREMADLLAITN